MKLPNTINIRTIELTVHEGNIVTLDEYIRIIALQHLQESMDKKIRDIEKTVKKDSSKEEKKLKKLEKADKKRDKVCEMGENAMKKKKK